MSSLLKKDFKLGETSESKVVLSIRRFAIFRGIYRRDANYTYDVLTDYVAKAHAIEWEYFMNKKEKWDCICKEADSWMRISGIDVEVNDVSVKNGTPTRIGLYLFIVDRAMSAMNEFKKNDVMGRKFLMMLNQEAMNMAIRIPREYQTTNRDMRKDEKDWERKQLQDIDEVRCLSDKIKHITEVDEDPETSIATRMAIAALLSKQRGQKWRRVFDGVKRYLTQQDACIVVNGEIIDRDTWTEGLVDNMRKGKISVTKGNVEGDEISEDDWKISFDA